MRNSGGDGSSPSGRASDPGDIREGDSIAVSGVCLTVIRLEGGLFQADASLETLSLTTLKDARPSATGVNLERAMRRDSRFGGHIVMGHVDGIGRITACRTGGRFDKVEIETPARNIEVYRQERSVAIDGISLTVNEQRDNRFTLNVIPYSAPKQR